VQDARRHGVDVRPVDINHSGATATLETPDPGHPPAYSGPGPSQPAVRLALTAVRAVGDDLAAAIHAERDRGGPFASVTDLGRRVELDSKTLEALATAGAFTSLGVARRAALWAAGAAARTRPGQLDSLPEPEPPALPGMSTQELLAAELWATGVSTDYPTRLVRDRLDNLGVRTAEDLTDIADGTRVTIAGIVTHRQRPPTAGGITFLSLEDETGLLNVIVPAGVWRRHQKIARDGRALIIRGMLERSGHTATQPGAINILAEHLQHLPITAAGSSRDFR
jgi:error-prone DNA polymerase